MGQAHPRHLPWIGPMLPFSTGFFLGGCSRIQGAGAARGRQGESREALWLCSAW